MPACSPLERGGRHLDDFKAFVLPGNVALNALISFLTIAAAVFLRNRTAARGTA